MNAQTAESLLMFSEQARPGLSGLDVKTLLGQLEHQYSELIAALEWFIEQGHTDKALRLVIALAPFWMMTKRLVEGSAWFDHVLEQPRGDDTHRGRACFEVGLLAFWQGNDARASELHRRALDIGQRNGDPTVTALALCGLARIALRGRGACNASSHLGMHSASYQSTALSLRTSDLDATYLRLQTTVRR